MKEVTFDFPISTRYKYYVEPSGHVYKIDTRNNQMEECYYHVARGYKRIRVTDVSCGIRRYIRVGRLVATYYCMNDNPSDYNIVDHIDGDKLNDDCSNLEWCSVAINTQRAYDLGFVKDRGGWISHPYSERLKSYANTEG